MAEICQTVTVHDFQTSNCPECLKLLAGNEMERAKGLRCCGWKRADTSSRCSVYECKVICIVTGNQFNLSTLRPQNQRRLWHPQGFTSQRRVQSQLQTPKDQTASHYFLIGEFEYDTHNLNYYSSSSGYSVLIMLSSCASEYHLFGLSNMIIMWSRRPAF